MIEITNEADVTLVLEALHLLRMSAGQLQNVSNATGNNAQEVTAANKVLGIKTLEDNIKQQVGMV